MRQEAISIIALAGIRAHKMTMSQAYQLREAQCLHRNVRTTYYEGPYGEEITEDLLRPGNCWERRCKDCNAHLDGDWY